MSARYLNDYQNYIRNRMKRDADFLAAFVAAYYERTHINPEEAELIEETIEGPTLRKKYYFRRRDEESEWKRNYQHMREEYILLRNRFTAIEKMLQGELANFLKHDDPACSPLYEKVLALRLKCGDYEFLQDRIKHLDTLLSSETAWANDYFHKWQAANNRIAEMEKDRYFKRQRAIDYQFEGMKQSLKEARKKIEELEAQAYPKVGGLLVCEWCGYEISYIEETRVRAFDLMRSHKTTCKKDPANVRIKQLEETLRFYGDPYNHESHGDSTFSRIDRDGGQMARKALSESKPQEWD